MISSPPAPPVIAPVSIPGAISSYAGIQVWTDNHKLMVRRDGQITAIPDADDGDVGRGPDGTPRLVFLRNNRVVVSQPDGSDPQTIPGTFGAGQPTIDGDSVAFAYDDRPVVITDGHRRRLPNMSTEITDLELHGLTLAVTDTYVSDYDNYDSIYIEQVNARHPRPKMVRTVTGGEAGHSLLGPSWAGGKLYFYEACLIDQRSCTGAFRYDPKTQRTAAATSHKALFGFAIDEDGTHAYEIPGTLQSDQNSEPSEVRYSKPLTFKRLG